jgi:hypothetical protein
MERGLGSSRRESASPAWSFQLPEIGLPGRVAEPQPLSEWPTIRSKATVRAARRESGRLGRRAGIGVTRDYQRLVLLSLLSSSNVPSAVILENMPSKRAVTTLPILLLTCLSTVATAQQQPSWERIDDLRLSRSHAVWKSPEALVEDLRSQNTAVRLKALRLVGIDANLEDLMNDAVPAEIELRYASLEGGHPQQAILLVEASSHAYASLAVPTANAWERIAVFECWCKYEGTTLLDDFVRVEYTYHFIPDLVLRASGGATGVYEQTEARFALKGGELRTVMSFISRRRVCQSNTCLYEHRWFISGQLVEAKANLDSSELNLDWNFADAHGFKSITCTAYNWYATSFKYIRSGAAHPCK